MKNTIIYKKFFEIILIIAIVFAGCSEAVQIGNEDGAEPHEPDVIKDCEGEFSLKGTKWKLVSIADSEKIREPEPTDCEECYTLWFDTDSKATSISIWWRQKLDLSNLSKFDNDWREHDTVYGVPGGPFFCEKYIDMMDYCFSGRFTGAIPYIHSYSATCDELKLNYGSTCLLFKPYDGDIQLETLLRGTRWKLSGIVDVQTGLLRELEPKECDECYTFEFFGDYSIYTRSIWARQALDLLNLDIELDPVIWQGFEGDPDFPLTSILYEQWLQEWIDEYGVQQMKFNGPYEDSYLFRHGIAHTESFEINPEEVKLYFVFQEKYYYLTFKCIYR